MGWIRTTAVCRERKRSAKPVDRLVLDRDGIVGDLHYGMSKRKQVSLLPYETVKEWFGEREIIPGRFGENLLAEGIDWESLKTGQKLSAGSVLLSIVRIGAATPASDAYTGFKVCVPMEPYFVFCQVEEEGYLEAGMEIDLLFE